jgi:hypothetical protein
LSKRLAAAVPPQLMAAGKGQPPPPPQPTPEMQIAQGQQQVAMKKLEVESKKADLEAAKLPIEERTEMTKAQAAETQAQAGIIKAQVAADAQKDKAQHDTTQQALRLQTSLNDFTKDQLLQETRRQEAIIEGLSQAVRLLSGGQLGG